LHQQLPSGEQLMAAPHFAHRLTIKKIMARRTDDGNTKWLREQVARQDGSGARAQVERGRRIASAFRMIFVMRSVWAHSELP